MCGAKKDQNLIIKQMLNDTFIESSLQDLEGVEMVEFDDYFEQRLRSQKQEIVLSYPINKVEEVSHVALLRFLDKNAVNTIAGRTFAESKMIRFVYQGLTIDFPHNWSFFEKLDGPFWLHVDPSSDLDMLVEIFKSFCSKDLESVLFFQNNEEIIVSLWTREQESLLKAVLSYFKHGIDALDLTTAVLKKVA